MVRPRPSWRQDGSPKNGHSRRQGAALGDAHAFSAHAGGGCTVSLLPGWPAHRAPARRLQTDTEDRRRSEREAAVRAGPRPLGTAATRFGDPRLLGRVGASRNPRARGPSSAPISSATRSSSWSPVRSWNVANSSSPSNRGRTDYLAGWAKRCSRWGPRAVAR